jgi:hypothetical protein
LLLVVGNCCSVFFVSINSLSQIPVVQVSAHRKLNFQCRYLRFGWIDAVFERLFGQQFHYYSPWFSTYFFRSSSVTCPTDARKYEGDQNVSFQRSFFTSGNSSLIRWEVTEIKLLINLYNVTNGFDANKTWIWSKSVSCSMTCTSNLEAIFDTRDFSLYDTGTVNTLCLYF